MVAQPPKGRRGLSSDEKRLWDKIAQTTSPIKDKHDYLISKDFYAQVNDLEKFADKQQRNVPKKNPKPRQVSEPNLSKTAALRSTTPLSKPPQITAQLDRRTKVSLKRGKLKIEAKLDLHGHTQDQARVAVDRFIHHAVHTNKRHVLIITGKGRLSETPGGVLRQAVPRWLSAPPLSALISGVDEASPRDGGEGALYVRIKKQR